MNDNSTFSGRLDYLDSLRGIAALYVMIYHCYLITISDYIGSITLSTAFGSPVNITMYFIHKILVQGHIAIVIFFVLSGFVLTASLSKHKTSYAGFILKRFFRIYPAFLVVICLSYAVHYVLAPQIVIIKPPFLSELLANNSLSLETFTNHLLMRGRITDIKLDPVMWTLVHEMRISLLFPLLYIGVIHFPRLALAFSFLCSLLCAFLVLKLTGTAPVGFNDNTDLASWLTTLYFIVMFVLGMVLYYERKSVVGFVNSIPTQFKYIILAVIIICFCKSEGDTETWSSAFTNYLFTVSSAGLIALILGTNKLQLLLRRTVFIWLGHISYSLYLIHLPVIFSVFCLFSKISNDINTLLVATIITSIIVSLVLAELMALTIEFPSIQIGHTISKWFAKRHDAELIA